MPPKTAKSDIQQALKKIKALDLRIKKLEAVKKASKGKDPILHGDRVALKTSPKNEIRGTLRRTCH